MKQEKKSYFQHSVTGKSVDGQILRLLVLVATTLLLVLIWQQKDILSSYSSYGYLGIFVINFISSSTVVLPLPGVAAVFLGGAILNPILTGFVSSLGATLGELFGYLMGFGGRSFFQKWEKHNLWFKKVESFFHKAGFITILTFAALPLPIFDFIGILAGTLNYPIWKFIIATFLGRIIRNLLIAWSGAKILPL